MLHPFVNPQYLQTCHNKLQYQNTRFTFSCFWFVPHQPTFWELIRISIISPGLRKKLQGLQQRVVLQASCLSCYPTNIAKALQKNSEAR